ncbi:hypothetical protein C815_01298 [Firmicutes bacterium M10-2]|nr:hypothetical protein C815_01298 [Firmicutes bacterium M10-2]
MISVAMTTYNGESFVLEQIHSIFHQTRSVDELIVVDDHSSDQTIPMILHLKQDHPDWNIKVFVNTKNLGYKRNFEKAIALSNGDHIFLSDQDDRWHENKVEVMMKIMEAHPKIEVLASSFDLIDQEGNEIAIEEKEDRSNHNFLLKKVEKDSLTNMTLEEFAYHNYFQGCALVMTKKMKQLFLENFTDLIPHDWLINMLASKENGMVYYDHPLFDYRIHDHNTIGMTGEVEKGWKAKWSRMNDLKIRQQFAKEQMESLSVLQKIDPQFFSAHPQYERRLSFCEDHLKFLEQRSFLSLLLQNRDPNYKQLKPLTARLYDLVFALNKNSYGKI